MTALATHPVDEPDLLSLVADEWTPTKVEFARMFRDCCEQEAGIEGTFDAAGPSGYINPSRVRARIRDRIGDHYNPRQLSALWCAASGRDGFLDKTDHLVQITGDGSRGNGNKSTTFRRLREAT